MQGYIAIAKLNILISVLVFTGCTAKTSSVDGFAVYRDIAPMQRNSYAFEEGAPENADVLLGLALGWWNQALGTEALQKARPGEVPDVKIVYRNSDQVYDSPAHLEMLGCMKGFGAVADCRIVLNIPRKVETAEEMAKLIHLANQGPLDLELYRRRNYAEDISVYLRDKLILMSLTHEIGHTLGLAHTEDKGCIMAAVPDGRLTFCKAEISAARKKLAVRSD